MRTTSRTAHLQRRQRLRQRAIHLGLAIPAEVLDDGTTITEPGLGEAGVDPDTVSDEDVGAR